MKKTTASKTRPSTKQFISKNWLNLATLLISLTALFISFQSNFVSKEANKIAAEAANANLQLVADIQPNSTIVINVSGCHDYISSKYQIRRLVADSAILTNTGGRGTALITIKFNDGYIRNYSIKIYDSKSKVYDSESKVYGRESQNKNEEIVLPLQFESGETKILYLKAISYDRYDQKKPAIQSTQKLVNLNEWSSANWEFIYADGTIIKKEYQKKFYWVYGFSDADLDDWCNY